MFRTLAIALMVLLSSVGAAEEQIPPRAMFALIIGVNHPLDSELAPLRYADDDAARYFDLFRYLGARTYLLTQPDENTSRLHAQATAEARAPSRPVLLDVVQQLEREIATARSRRVETVFYLIYAGHGYQENGQGYLGLAKERLTSQQIIQEVIEPLGADQTHVVVDACNSYYLAHSRGPGGQRRALRGFSHVQGLAAHPKIGLLFSSTSSRDSHEWEAVQAGVFSHELRSGLYGAADADHNGWISYQEIAAFVERANHSIPNERFRPKVYSRPPSNSEYLIGMPSGEQTHLEIDGTRAAHYYIEDSQGVRIMDFHNARDHAMRVLLPASRQLLYLHNTQDKREYPIHPTPGTIKISSLTPANPRTQDRGAAHHAFRFLFDLPFDRQVVNEYHFASLSDLTEVTDTAAVAERPWLGTAGWVSTGLAGAAITAAVVLSIDSQNLAESLGPNPTHQEVSTLNQDIAQRNLATSLLFGMAGAAAVSAALCFWWPEDSIKTNLAWSPAGGASLVIGGNF